MCHVFPAYIVAEIITLTILVPYLKKSFYALLVLFCRLIVALPLPIWQCIARSLGSILYHLNIRRIHVIRTNINTALSHLSQSEKELLVKQTAQNTVLGIFEAFFGWWGPEKEIRRHTNLNGFAQLDNALAKGNGVIILGAHFTSMELSAKVMGMQKKVNATYRRQNNPLLDDIIKKARGAHFNALIEKSETRRLIKSLKKGEAVWLSIDQDAGRHGSVFPTFFGTEAATVAIIDKLIRITGAEILFYSHFRSGKGSNTSYSGRFHPPIECPKTASPLQVAQKINDALEAILRENDVSQYFWVHKRYKTRPTSGEPKIY